MSARCSSDRAGPGACAAASAGGAPSKEHMRMMSACRVLLGWRTSDSSTSMVWCGGVGCRGRDLQEGTAERLGEPQRRQGPISRARVEAHHHHRITSKPAHTQRATGALRQCCTRQPAGPTAARPRSSLRHTPRHPTQAPAGDQRRRPTRTGRNMNSPGEWRSDSGGNAKGLVPAFGRRRPARRLSNSQTRELRGIQITLTATLPPGPAS
jgi:hypothetical protein